MNKWLEEFGIYDFLGVMCPGIFALGIGVYYTLNGVPLALKAADIRTLVSIKTFVN